MNIVYINNFAGSKTYGMELRPYYLCKNWVSSGHKVSIIASSFVHTRTKQPVVNTNFQKEVIEGVNYYWIKCPKYEGIGISRLFSFMLFILRLIFKSRFAAKNIKPDYVIASSTYLLDIYPAFLIARLSKAKLIYEFPDIQPLSLIELFGYSKYHPFIFFLSITEKFIYQKSDKVISVLPNGYAHMKKFGLPPEKYSLIPNGIDVQSWNESKLEIPESLRKLIDSYNGNNFFLVGYAGYIAKQNSLETLIATAELLKDKKIIFIVVGEGPDKDYLVKLSEEKKTDNVRFCDRIPKESVPAFLSRMDSLFIAFNKLHLYDYGVNTNKLYEYMMQGKPVIQSQNAGNDLVAEGNCGISCPAEDPESISEAIIKLQNSSEMIREEMGNNGRKHVMENYDYKRLSERYLQVILK